jgi:hypothetical protein
MLIPTELRTKLLSVLPAELKERMFWSSTVESAKALDRMGNSIDEILAGNSTRDAERSMLKRVADELGFGNLSDARLNLILDTNVQLAEGYGSFTQGQDQGILDTWPAQELVRVNVPRKPRDWPDRWEEAGGELVDGRMVAAKDDDIWDELGSPDLFEDGLGNPFPPFAFNSGMDVRDVSRSDAVRLGVIEPGQRIEPEDRGINDDLKQDLDLRDANLKSTLLDFLGNLARFDKSGVLRYTGKGAE